MSTQKQIEKDRHSRTGVASGPKKKGGGGKGVWGVGGLDDLKETPISRDDPNYISSEDEDTVLAPVEPVIPPSPFEDLCREYFASGDVDEARKNLNESKFSENQKTQFVKQILVYALEKNAYERELTSQLLSQLYSNTLSAEVIAQGFRLTLQKLDDLVLDTPQAAEILGKFLARAIMDEIIPPAFLKATTEDSTLVKEAIALAHGMTTEKHRSGRLEHIWGPGDLSSVKRLKEEVTLLLDEYITNGDLVEAENSLQKLNAPSFNFQVVKLAIRIGLQRGPTQRDKLHALLKGFAKTGVLSADAIKKGFAVSRENLPDLQLDVPDAKKIFDEFVQKAQEEGYLEK